MFHQGSLWSCRRRLSFLRRQHLQLRRMSLRFRVSRLALRRPSHGLVMLPMGVWFFRPIKVGFARLRLVAEAPLQHCLWEGYAGL